MLFRRGSNPQAVRRVCGRVSDGIAAWGVRQPTSHPRKRKRHHPGVARRFASLADREDHAKVMDGFGLAVSVVRIWDEVEVSEFSIGRVEAEGDESFVVGSPVCQDGDGGRRRS